MELLSIQALSYFQSLAVIQYAQDGGDWIILQTINHNVMKNVENGAEDYQMDVRTE